MITPLSHHDLIIHHMTWWTFYHHLSFNNIWLDKLTSLFVHLSFFWGLWKVVLRDLRLWHFPACLHLYFDELTFIISTLPSTCLINSPLSHQLHHQLTWWTHLYHISFIINWLDELTFITSALPAPQEANTAQRQLLTTGRVIVTRAGGGFGESDIGAISLSFSWNAPNNETIFIALINVTV